MKKTVGLFAVPFLLVSCGLFEQESLLEMYVSYNDFVTDLTETTIFNDLGEDPLSFEVGQMVFLKIDVYYLNDNQKDNEDFFIDFIYPNTQELFFNPLDRDDLTSNVENDDFIYHLNIDKNMFQTFYFLIETSSPIEFTPEFRSTKTISLLDQDILSPNEGSEPYLPNVKIKGKAIALTPFSFVLASV